jgi:hypothetical protein
MRTMINLKLDPPSVVGLGVAQNGSAISHSPPSRPPNATRERPTTVPSLEIRSRYRIGAAAEWRRAPAVRETRASGHEARRGQLRGAWALCGWPEMGQLGPRMANLVPKYYGVNTLDETFTPVGDGRRRRDRIMEAAGLSLVDSSLAAKRRARYLPRDGIGRAIALEPRARHKRSAAAA